MTEEEKHNALKEDERLPFGAYETHGSWMIEQFDNDVWFIYVRIKEHVDKSGKEKIGPWRPVLEATDKDFAEQVFMQAIDNQDKSSILEFIKKLNQDFEKWNAQRLSK